MAAAMNEGRNAYLENASETETEVSSEEIADVTTEIQMEASEFADKE